MEDMKAHDYLSADERILARAKVQADPYALFTEGRPGEIVCSENRVIHAKGRDVVDVSINGVDSVEYRAPKMPRTYLYAGIVALGIGLFASGLDSGLSMLGFLSGLMLLGVAYWLRTSVLALHTPSKTYEFRSRDDSLVEIAHALRAREMGENEDDRSAPLLDRRTH